MFIKELLRHKMIEDIIGNNFCTFFGNKDVGSFCTIKPTHISCQKKFFNFTEYTIISTNCIILNLTCMNHHASSNIGEIGDDN